MAQVFEERLRQGAIVHQEEYELPDGSRKDKFYVVLNQDCSTEYIYHALTTSQMDKVRDRGWLGKGVVIPAGELPAFPRETFIFAERLDAPPLRRDALEKLFQAGVISIYEPLPPKYLRPLLDILCASGLVSRAVKARVC